MIIKVEVINLPISSIKPYEKNAKTHTEEQINHIIESIKEFGFCDPIGIWGDDNICVEGHGRLLALQKMGEKEVECIRLDHLTDEQRRAYTLVHNQTTMETPFDFALLASELDAIFDIDMHDFGFEDIPEDIAANYSGESTGALKEKFIMPPFSVLDAKQGDWQKRKKEWLKIIDSGEGRDDGLLGGGMKDIAIRAHAKNLTGTSIFDPVLCEIMINWFSPRGGAIIDPFAGGSVRGIVSSFLEREYYGNDLSPKQIKANVEEFGKLERCTTVFDGALKQPVWSVGDSRNIDTLIKRDGFDTLLTCPPYADLEVYSQDPADISNMEYEDFLSVYTEILSKSIAKLKENAFIVIVVGEVRDKKGYYRNFIGDTINAVESTGAKYYNEIVFITMYATIALRAARQFEGTRKIVNTHQKALVFLNSGADADLIEYMTAFEREKILTPMKESILVFLRGDSKLAKNDLADFKYDLF